MRFDLHIHSNHSSDSSLSVEDILKQAIKKGLDGIAICDHNTVEGSIRAIERAREMNIPLIVLPGTEISTNEGHLIVLGIRENIPSNLPYIDTIRIAREKGGIVIAAHPFKMRSIGFGAKEADAIETFNSRCLFGENTEAKDMAKALRKPEVGGSDSHILATIGLGFTDIDTQSDESSVLSAIKEGRTCPGGQIAPLYVIFIQILRGVFRRAGKLMNRIYSKIFRNNGTI